MEMKHSAFSTLKPVETENPGKINKEESIQTKKGQWDNSASIVGSGTSPPGSQEDIKMKAPEFYAEWIPILRDFAVRKDDDEVITAMKNGCIPCSQTPLTRLSYRLEEAIKMRYKAIMEDFERNQAEAHNEAGIETALTRLKDDLEKLKDAVYIPALPESIRLKFPEAVDQAADAAQHALEESARRDHSGIMSHLLQDHRINDLQEAK